MKEKVKTKKKNIFNILSDILTYTTFAVVFIALIFVFSSRIQGKDPSILGYKLYVVKTDSMEPTLPVGSVLIEHVDKDVTNYDVGTIITFQASTSQGIINNSHRVIAYYYKRFKDDGSYFLEKDFTSRKTVRELQDYWDSQNIKIELVGYITQGDNSPAEDPNPVLFNAIKSSYVRKSGFITWFYSLFKSFWGLLLIVIIPALLIIIFQIIAYVKVRTKVNVEKAVNDKQIEMDKLKEEAIKEYLENQKNE